MKAKISQTKTGKLLLYVSLDEFEREEYLLQKGKQPSGLFTIIIR